VGQASKSAKSLLNVSQEIHTLATRPLYLVWFVLDTTGFPLHNPAWLLLRAHSETEFACGDHWGKHDAIFAGVDRAVHQSGVLRAGALVAGASLWPQCGPGVLPQLREFLASGTAANWSAPSHETAFADCAPAASQAKIDFFVGVAPSYNRPEAICLRSIFLELFSKLPGNIPAHFRIRAGLR
jgi:hypothetical protein